MSDTGNEAALLAAHDEIVAAWKRGDVDAVLDRLHEDVEFVFAIGHRPLRGRERVRRLLDALGGQQKDVRWRFVHRAVTGNVLLAEGIDDYVNGEGRRIRNPFVTVYEFEDGRVRHWRDYYDQSLLKELEGGAPLSEWVEPLVSEERGGA